MPDDLGGASVYVGGRKAPLHYVSPGQINFLVPYGLPKNTTLDVLVKRGDRLSASIPIRMVDAAPGIFTYDSSGSGPGLVYDASYSFITSLRPAAVGQTVTLLATGLGDVDPALTADQQTASDVRRTVLPVKVTVGGKQAEMLFAGLLSGYAGVYQVAFVLPAGVSGNAVPLQIEVGGYTSNEVTIAVR